MLGQTFPFPIILQQAFHHLSQTLHHLGILHHHGSLFIHQRHGILRLVIFCHVRRGYQHHGFPQQAQLRNRTRTRSCHHQISTGIRQIHPFQKRHKLHIFRHTSLQLFFQLLVVITPALPDHLHVLPPRNLLQPSHHSLVNRPGTQTTSGDQHRFLIRIQPVKSNPLHPFIHGIQQILPYRIPRKYNLFLWKKTFHSLVSHANLGRLLCQQLISYPCIRILLL